MGTRKTLDEFMSLKLANSDVFEPGLKIYMRKSFRIGIDLEIGSVNAEHPGRGYFTKFLDKYEPFYTFYIQNVLNDRLEDYLIRRGYVNVELGAPAYAPPCLVMKTNIENVGKFDYEKWRSR